MCVKGVFDLLTNELQALTKGKSLVILGLYLFSVIKVEIHSHMEIIV